MQIEYLVVKYTKDDPKVTLSLRQAEILLALAEDEKLQDKGGVVPDLQVVKKTKYAPLLSSKHMLTQIEDLRFLSSILSLVDICWRLHLASHGALDSRTCWM